MYVYVMFGENYTTNMGDMAKTPFFQFFLLLLSLFFFSLNPSISKTVGDKRSKILYIPKLSSMTQRAVTCQNVFK